MINFRRENSRMIIEFDIGVGKYCNYHFYHNLSDTDDAIAELFIKEAQNRFRQRVCEIRKKAYQKGWKDAKWKKRKIADFSSRFDDHDFVGW